MKPTDWTQRLLQIITRLQAFPWVSTARVLRQRFQEDHLGLTAGSLTFTSITSLVPLATVALAIFSVFPSFAQMQVMLQRWMSYNLFPQAIAHSVMAYISDFASKASQLGWLSLVFLFFSALAVMLTVDSTLNKIWRVRSARPLGQRILVYWAGLTLGPLVLTASIALTSYALASSKGWMGLDRSWARGLNHVLQFVLVTGLAAAMYRFVPNTVVRWKHALAGGFFVALGMQVAKWGLGLYIGSASVSSIYGAFAIVPILLLWLYIVWVIALLGAVIAAYLPSLLSGIARAGDAPSFGLELSLEVLQALHAAQTSVQRGLDAQQLSQRLRVSDLQLEPALELLQKLDWVARLAEAEHLRQTAPRWVLLIDPDTTPLAPLLQATVFPPAAAFAPFHAHMAQLNLPLSAALPAAD
jgi:membrane protein